MTQPKRPSHKRTPEQQAQLDEFHQKIGQALAGNLNLNVLLQAERDGTITDEQRTQLKELKAKLGMK